MNQDTAPISTRYVLLAFFAVVLLCAVFFSLGFFLGRENRNPAAPATEHVIPSSDIPPTVNTPDEQPSSASEDSAEPAAPATASPPAPSSSPTPPGNSESASPAEAPASSHPPAARPERASASRTVPQTNAEGSEAPNDGAATAAALTRLPPGLTVQVAALSSRQDAANMVKVLKSRGYPALLFAPDETHSRDIFYRVIVGPYKNRRQVTQVRSKLAEEGFKPFIRQ